MFIDKPHDYLTSTVSMFWNGICSFISLHYIIENNFKHTSSDDKKEFAATDAILENFDDGKGIIIPEKETIETTSNLTEIRLITALELENRYNWWIIYMYSNGFFRNMWIICCGRWLEMADELQ